jgi:REP element-mobilizing transposase RayT
MHQPPHAHYNRGVWHSRGYLPHFEQPGQLQSITFRLADSLPQAVLLELEALPHNLQEERRAEIEALLDRGHGECLLARPAIAQLVEDAMLHFDGERYRLLAWVVMPNHVHMLCETLPEFLMSTFMKSIKSYSARLANKLLGREGPFWMGDYHDRAVRDEDHLKRIIEYIHLNPVKAGLVDRPEDWRWSSAWNQRLGVLPL